jgi:aminoglycoside phosphotransferase (APT) family kinase protein
MPSPDPIDATVDVILRAYGFAGPWEMLPATGVANRIYATERFVLRVATDYSDAVADARTESVAAPAAYAAAIRTPLLIVFDDSRRLVDRPLSIWERVHGETLGLARLDADRTGNVWREVGQELARLHDRVRACPDPRGYLDPSGYELNLHDRLRQLVDAHGTDAPTARATEDLIDELAPFVNAAECERCFLHQDLHAMNVMCTNRGSLLAIIDWGDAGWGDPTLDFASIPLDMIPAALDGYGTAGRRKLGANPEARFAWSHLHNALDDAVKGRCVEIPVDALRRFLDRAA